MSRKIAFKCMVAVVCVMSLTWVQYALATEPVGGRMQPVTKGSSGVGVYSPDVTGDNGSTSTPYPNTGSTNDSSGGSGKSKSNTKGSGGSSGSSSGSSGGS